MRLVILIAAILSLSACASLSGGGTTPTYNGHVCQTGGRSCG
jgi:hypothetical protein